MIRKKQPLHDAKIASAALKLAASRGWKSVTLEAIAKSTKLPSSILKARFASPYDLVPLISAEIDREAFAHLSKMSGTPHDQLFDVLMARFDILQKYRKAILSMAETARTDRPLSCALGRTTLDGLYRVIDLVDITTPPRPILAAGLGAIYSWAFVIWCKDNSRDMAKTMAAVDRGLRLTEKIVTLLKRHS